VLAPLALAALFAGPVTLTFLIAAFVGVGAWEWGRMCRNASSHAWLLVGLLILGLAGAALIWLRHMHGIYAVLWLFGTVWATDIGAYAVGKLVGGPRIAPTISPNKTWAGLAGGVTCAVIWSIAFAYAIEPGTVGMGPLVAFGAIAAVMAQAGDFAVSFAKRRFGLKDSSGLIPGHGGVLDRVAGLLTTGPALALLLLAINSDARAW